MGPSSSPNYYSLLLKCSRPVPFNLHFTTSRSALRNIGEIQMSVSLIMFQIQQSSFSKSISPATCPPNIIVFLLNSNTFFEPFLPVRGRTHPFCPHLLVE